MTVFKTNKYIERMSGAKFDVAQMEDGSWIAVNVNGDLVPMTDELFRIQFEVPEEKKV